MGYVGYKDILGRQNLSVWCIFATCNVVLEAISWIPPQPRITATQCPENWPATNVNEHVFWQIGVTVDYCQGPRSSVCRLQRWHDMYFIYNLIKIGLRLACVLWAKRDYMGILPQIMRRSAVVQCLGALWLPLKTALLPSMACRV